MFEWLTKHLFNSTKHSAPTSTDGILVDSTQSKNSQIVAQEFRLKGHDFFDNLDWRNAANCYKQAIAAHPGLAADHYNLGYSLWELNQPQDAKTQLLQATAIDQTLDGAYFMLGDISRKQGNIDEAISFFEKAIALKPDFEEFIVELGGLYTQQGSTEKAINCYEQIKLLNPQSDTNYSSLLLTLQYQTKLSRSELFAKHQEFSEKFEIPLATITKKSHEADVNNRKLKIGYISADFRKHSIALFMIPILAHHDKEKFQIFCYYNHAEQDEITGKIAELAGSFVHCSEMSDQELNLRILADGIDILIDLSGHTGGNRLLVFARKPAPVQISYLGYIDTTGLKAMDYRLTNIDADPVENDLYYSEQLYRFKEGLWWCYRPADNLPEVTSLPANKNGYVTFASTNNVAKISDENIKIWSEILNNVPNSRLTLMGIPPGIAQQRISSIFANFGINKNRLTFHGRVTLEQYRTILLDVDIALDTFPYNGGTTTCETLSLGLPLVTLVGSSFVSRMGYALLKDIGLEKLAGLDHADYIRIAVELAHNIEYLATIRAGMRERIAQSSLCDEQGFTKNLENAYMDMWQKYLYASESKNN